MPSLRLAAATGRNEVNQPIYCDDQITEADNFLLQASTQKKAQAVANFFEGDGMSEALLELMAHSDKNLGKAADFIGELRKYIEENEAI